MTETILFLDVSPRSILCNLLFETLFTFLYLKKGIAKSLCHVEHFQFCSKYKIYNFTATQSIQNLQMTIPK